MSGCGAISEGKRDEDADVVGGSQSALTNEPLDDERLRFLFFFHLVSRACFHTCRLT